MSYVKRIICLANAYKNGGTCVAGIEIEPEDGRGDIKWIRPVSGRQTRELTRFECQYQNSQTPKVLDILDVPLLQPVPQLHQTENHLIDATRQWIKVGEFRRDPLGILCDQPQSLWANGGSTTVGHFDCVSEVGACGERRSLLLIRPTDFAVHIEMGYPDAKRIYRGNFTYNDWYYSFSLTDPLARGAFAGHMEGDYRVRDAYICVSLTMPYAHDGRCHKLVAAIIGEQPFVENRVWKSPYSPSATPRIR
jgi:hypothetical protein